MSSEIETVPADVRERVTELVRKAKRTSPDGKIVIAIRSPKCNANLTPEAFRNRERKLHVPQGYYTPEELAGFLAKPVYVNVFETAWGKAAYTDAELSNASVTVTNRNGTEEISFQYGAWSVVARPTTLSIGCQTHSYESWQGDKGTRVVQSHGWGRSERTRKRWRQLLAVAIPMLKESFAGSTGAKDVKAIEEEFRAAFPSADKK